jgi:hypothetical protein
VGTFKVSGVTYTGKVVWLGQGSYSQILSDSNVLTVTSGTSSSIDNLTLLNITAPWIITRNPANWTSPPFATLQQSNGLGYQPTVNDADIWSASVFTASQSGVTLTVTAITSGSVQPGATLSGTGVTPGSYISGQVSGTPGGIGAYLCNSANFGSTTVTTLALTAPQQSQQIGPTITFTGAATDIQVSRIYGRFVRLDILDSQYSRVINCDIRGGKGTWGGIVFDNATNNVQVGVGNKAPGTASGEPAPSRSIHRTTSMTIISSAMPAIMKFWAAMSTTSSAATRSSWVQGRILPPLQH